MRFHVVFPFGETVLGVEVCRSGHFCAFAGFGGSAPDYCVHYEAGDFATQEFLHGPAIASGLERESEVVEEFGTAAGGGFVVHHPEEGGLGENGVDLSGVEDVEVADEEFFVTSFFKVWCVYVNLIESVR